MEGRSASEGRGGRSGRRPVPWGGWVSVMVSITVSDIVILVVLVQVIMHACYGNCKVTLACMICVSSVSMPSSKSCCRLRSTARAAASRSERDGGREKCCRLLE